MPMPKKSEALHALHGTKPAAPPKVTESHIAAGRPKFPKGISPEQRIVFKRICRLLEQRRAVTEADCEILHQYACLHELWQQALNEIRKEGIICSYERADSHGKVFVTRKKNEACAVADSCSRQMLAILRELGLSPKSRDAVKPTGSSTSAIVPGSMAAIYGENLEGLGVTPMKPLVVPAPAEIEDDASPSTDA